MLLSKLARGGRAKATLAALLLAVVPFLSSNCGSSGPCGGEASTARLHADCSNEPCATGQTCMAYYGVAGAQGPLIKTCEIQCCDNAVCPSPTQCGTTVDGPPGNTCR
jgi:hypothetical protein